MTRCRVMTIWNFPECDVGRRSVGRSVVNIHTSNPLRWVRNVAREEQKMFCDHKSGPVTTVHLATKIIHHTVQATGAETAAWNTAWISLWTLCRSVLYAPMSCRPMCGPWSIGVRARGLQPRPLSQAKPLFLGQKLNFSGRRQQPKNDQKYFFCI